jgi:hypothetical protein
MIQNLKFPEPRRCYGGSGFSSIGDDDRAAFHHFLEDFVGFVFNSTVFTARIVFSLAFIYVAIFLIPFYRKV